MSATPPRFLLEALRAERAHLRCDGEVKGKCPIAGPYPGYCPCEAMVAETDVAYAVLLTTGATRVPWSEVEQTCKGCTGDFYADKKMRICPQCIEEHRHRVELRNGEPRGFTPSRPGAGPAGEAGGGMG